MRLATALGLVTTGSSDCHGSGRSTASPRTPPRVLAVIEDQAGGVPVLRPDGRRAPRRRSARPGQQAARPALGGRIGAGAGDDQLDVLRAVLLQALTTASASRRSARSARTAGRW